MWLFAAAAACSPNCYAATCDYWDGGYWGTCEHLSYRWGCDCQGCKCDGCPQADCDAPRFDPSQCPFAGNAKCNDGANTPECALDGGDCCEETCQGVLCGTAGYQCKDPQVLEARSPAVESPAADSEAAEEAVSEVPQAPSFQEPDAEKASRGSEGAE